MALGGVGMATVNVGGAQALAGSPAAGLVDQGHHWWHMRRLTLCTSLVLGAAFGRPCTQLCAGPFRQMMIIICPMNGVDGHFIVLNGGDGAGCVPASRLLSLGGEGDHCLLRLSASVKAQWLALGRCLVVMVWCFSRRAPVEQVCPYSPLRPVGGVTTINYSISICLNIIIYMYNLTDDNLGAWAWPW